MMIIITGIPVELIAKGEVAAHICWRKSVKGCASEGDERCEAVLLDVDKALVIGTQYMASV